MSEQNFTKVLEIAVEGVKQPDWIVQHVDGWYARVRAQRVRRVKCPTCQAHFTEAGVKPGMQVSVYVAECDSRGNLMGETVECQNVIAPPVSGTIDWPSEKKRVVRHALDQLLLHRADLPDDEEPAPFTQ